MGSVLDIIKGDGKRKKSPSFTIHKHKKKLEKNKAQNHPKDNQEKILKLKHKQTWLMKKN